MEHSIRSSANRVTTQPNRRLQERSGVPAVGTGEGPGCHSGDGPGPVLSCCGFRAPAFLLRLSGSAPFGAHAFGGFRCRESTRFGDGRVFRSFTFGFSFPNGDAGCLTVSEAGHWSGGTTSTGQWAWRTQCSVVFAVARNVAWPRCPTTSRSAPFDALSRARGVGACTT